MADVTARLDVLRSGFREAMKSGSAGRPKVVAAYPEGDRGMVVVYEDGNIARRVWRDATPLVAGGYVWVAEDGPDYDALFTETVRVETDAPKVGVWNWDRAYWRCSCAGDMAKNWPYGDRCPDCHTRRPADD